MVVWWTKHQLGPKTTRDSPNHTPQDACFLALAHTCHVHISTPSRYPLATSGTFERCHGSVVDQAPTWPENNTRMFQPPPTSALFPRPSPSRPPLATCTSRPHRDTHSRRLAHLKGVMVVWWTKHQLGPKTTRECSNHPPQVPSFPARPPLGPHLPRAHLDPIEIPTRDVWHI